MRSNLPRPLPISVATLNIDLDDIEPSPREEYKPTYSIKETASSYSDNRRNRSCFITLILVLIILALLSIAGLIISIYALVLNTTNNQKITISSATTSASTTTVVTTSTSIACSSSPFTSYQYSTATPSQCSNYTNNTDATRNIAYTGSINYCDNVSPFNTTTPIWIRFLDPAGKIISNVPVSPNSCGTVATGWYAGQYPVAFYTTATSIVCFYYSTNTCSACSSISITNCETYYVFLLSEPPSCNYRYCTL